MEKLEPIRPPLVRSASDRVIAGVCGGVAAHLIVPSSWVRVAFAILSLLGGAGIVLYIFLLVTVPNEGAEAEVTPLRRVFTPASEREGAGAGLDSPGQATARKWPMAEILLGGSLLIAGATLVAVQFGVKLRAEVILPGLAVLVGVGLTWWLITDRDRPEKNLLPRILAALALVAVGVLMFFITSEEPNVLTVIGAALAVLAGVGLAIAPWLLRLNRELVAEKAARARESERAEIAAHLHDSVLQTLALIQQRADPATDVARIARGQERELREWLFRTADGAPESNTDGNRGTMAELIAAHAANLEKEHPVRFEVVVVGERIVAPEAIVAAAREAMLNAARHAGGDVTVYIETTSEQFTVDVRDRGPGFNLHEIVESRFGVRESILGRMERAGATATISPGPGGTGISVHLAQTRSQEENLDATRA